ncbi:MAG: multidrug effflux MFS transporter [Prevotella sp.]|nr:multidrug effflux MFS transporter [Bacteroides sp.]MCM1365976.1 multidrug effflux MFS transporter [Prevotella sp.]MCM1436603.1 multidrug effflux MFS transporter [Prevotella sp.]
MNNTNQKLNNSEGVGINFTFFIIYMAGLSAFGSFVNDMYLPSLPEMTGYFDCSIPMAQMGLTTGMIGLALGQLLMGPISDKYGRKPILLSGLIFFIVSAVISVFSPTIHFFLLMRFFQGLGASAGYFLARTIPADVYSGRALAKTMAIIGGINGFAPASSPVLGGLVSDRWGWRGVFVVLALFGVLLLVMSPKLRETLSMDKRDTGSVWSAFKKYCVLLRNRKFMVHVLLKGSGLGVLFAYISGGPFIYEHDFGFSELDFGLIMGGNALLVALGSMLALRFKVLRNAAIYGSCGLLALSVLLVVLVYRIGDFWSFELTILPILFCLGMIFTVGNTLAMDEGRDIAGGASAILGICGYVFGAVVSPLVGRGVVIHSTAITIMAVSSITFIFAMITKNLSLDADMQKS